MAQSNHKYDEVVQEYIKSIKQATKWVFGSPLTWKFTRKNIAQKANIHCPNYSITGWLSLLASTIQPPKMMLQIKWNIYG